MHLLIYVQKSWHQLIKQHTNKHTPQISTLGSGSDHFEFLSSLVLFGRRLIKLFKYKLELNKEEGQECRMSTILYLQLEALAELPHWSSFMTDVTVVLFLSYPPGNYFNLLH